MLSYQPSAAIPRSTVVAVIAATMIAQVASIMGVAVFPVIAPKLAEEMGVEPALVGYQVSLTFYDAAQVKSFSKLIPISFQHPVNPKPPVLAFIFISRSAPSA